MGAALWPVLALVAPNTCEDDPIVRRGNSDEDARRGAAGRWVLLLFALGALGMLGTAAYGLAHGQHGQRQSLERRFQGRAQLGSALVGSLFSASAPTQQAQAVQRYGAKLDPRELTRQAAAGGSNFIAITDARGKLLAASAGTPPSLGKDLAAQPMFFQRALTSNSYGLSGVTPEGSLLTALPFGAKSGTRVEVTGVKASLLAAFLGGTLKQVSNNASSTSLIIDDQGGVIAEQGRSERPGQPLHDSALRAALARHADGTLGERLYTSQPIGSTGWRLVLLARSDAVFQPVSGTNRWLPWVILVIGALALASVGVLLR